MEMATLGNLNPGWCLLPACFGRRRHSVGQGVHTRPGAWILVDANHLLQFLQRQSVRHACRAMPNLPHAPICFTAVVQSVHRHSSIS